MQKLSNSRSRRDFIKLLSCAAASSFLTLPSPRVHAQTRAPLRFLTLIDTYGLPTINRNDLWTSTSAGDFALQEEHLGTVLKPLSAYRDNMLVVSNIDLESRLQTGDSSTHHYLTTHTLTGSSALAETREAGQASYQIKHASIDVHIGQYLSNQYGLARPRIYDHLFFSDYEERGATTFCYTADGVQKRSIAGALNARNALFDDTAAGSDAVVAKITSQARLEAITLVEERLTAISDSLINANKEQVIEAYQASVNSVAKELELKSENVVTMPAELAGVVNGGRATSSNLPDMFKNIYHAFAFDMASSITYSFGGEKINQLRHAYLYDEAKHNDAEVLALLNKNFHAASHRTDDVAGKVHEIVRTFQSQQLANLLDRLSTTLDSDGSMMLDNTVVFFTSQMSNNTHNVRGYPYLVIAGKNTGFRAGYHYDCSGSSNNDLLTTLAQGMTMSDDNFGGHHRNGNYISALNNGPISKLLV